MIKSNLRRRAPTKTLFEAKIIQFPMRAVLANRLTVTDRQDALRWIRGEAGSACRLEISEECETDELGDFISIYRLGQVWASWGAARRGGAVLLWKADIGRDLGTFPNMQAALDVVSGVLNPAQPPAKLEDAVIVALKGLRRQIDIADRLLENQILGGRVLAAGMTKNRLSELRSHERTLLAQLQNSLPDDLA